MDKKFVRIILMVGLLALLPLVVSAVTVSISPDRVAPGEQVTATFEDLPDHARVSIEIAATFSAVPGSPFSFENSNFNIPFALANGSMSASLQNTVRNNIAVKQGDAEVRFSGDSVNGMYSKSFAFDVVPGTYDYIRLSGTASGDTILSNLRISGTKTGPASGEIRFNVAGVENGEVAITMRVNDTVVIAKTVVIAPDEPVPTTEATPVTTQGGNTGGSSNENSGSSNPVTTATTAVSSTEIAGSSTTTETTQVTVTTIQNTTPPTTVPVSTAATTPSPTKTKAAPGLLFIPAGLAVAFLLYRRR